MSFFNIFAAKKPSTAGQAKERLQLIIAHERTGNEKGPDFMPKLKQEIMEVLAKYIKITDETANVSIEKEAETDLLKIDIVIPQKG